MPAIAWGPNIKAGTKNYDIAGGLDFMATFASLANVKLPEKDREGQPIIFDSYDISPILFGTGNSARESWFYFTEDELSPGAFRWHQWKFVFNSVEMTVLLRAASRWIATSAGKVLRNTLQLCRKFSICGRIRKSAMTSS